MHGQVLVVGGYRGSAVRSCQRLTPCEAGPIPAGFGTNSTLARAEPIRNGDSTSPVRDLGRKKAIVQM